MGNEQVNVGALRGRAKAIFFFGAFGGILFGYDIGVMTGALPLLDVEWRLSSRPGALGWITGSVMLGAILGSISAGYASDHLGRRKVILGAAGIFVIGALLSGAAPAQGVLFLVVSRVFLGLAVGAASALVPAYLSEMAPAGIRGRLSGLNQVMIVSGMLISYIVDYLLDYLPQAIAWRWMLALAAAPGVVLLLGTLRLPESPRYLVKVGRVGNARSSLLSVRGGVDVEDELSEIVRTAEAASAGGIGKWRLLLAPRYRLLLIAGVGVAALQQFQGANAIFYYLPLIVRSVQRSTIHSALMWPIVQGVILVLGSLLFIAIGDRFSRRRLLMVGGGVMAVSFVLPYLLGALGLGDSPAVLIVLLSSYVAFYSFTWAPLTWVVVGEIFPLEIRGRAAGAAAACNWIGSFLVALAFPVLVSAVSEGAVFFIFGLICALGVIFVRFRVPETKGLTLEEIEAGPARSDGSALSTAHQ